MYNVGEEGNRLRSPPRSQADWFCLRAHASIVYFLKQDFFHICEHLESGRSQRMSSELGLNGGRSTVTEAGVGYWSRVLLEVGSGIP